MQDSSLEKKHADGLLLSLRRVSQFVNWLCQLGLQPFSCCFFMARL